MSEEEKINGENNYSASNIQVLEGLEAVRKRPAMYIGDISEKGLHHLVYEVVDNSIDEALAGYCDHIEVTINEDNSITVQDNGRGIPVDFHEKEKKSALEVVMTVLHAGGKFDKGSYKVSGGLHGVGVSCVNALSTHMTTQVFRGGKIYQQEYSCGHPLYSVKEVGTADITGTKQTFWPDDTIFTVTEYKFDILQARMRELAYLNKGITISLTDRRIKEEDGSFKKEIFHSDEGVKEFVRFLNRNNEALINDVIYLNTEKNNTPIECAIMYNTGYRESLHSYVNNINTIEGGTHEAGFRSALTRVLKKYAEDTKALEKAKAGEYDIILLDLMLPKMDGLEVCQQIREFSNVPIIMLTAKGEDMDKILGLEYGADDYVTKPFNILEVKARIKAIIRRAGSKQDKQEKAKTVEVGELKLDCEGRRVFISGKEINLTAKEFDVLELLVFNPNKVYSRENLLNIVWGYEYTVDVHIRRLREKIEANPSEPKYVHTKWGVGYYFQA